MKKINQTNHILYVFEHDLRLEDNLTFNKACELSRKNNFNLMCLYCFQPWYLNSLSLSETVIGRARFKFLRQSLSDLKEQLAAKGLSLSVRIGSVSDVISSLHNRYLFHSIFYSSSAGYNENKQWHKLVYQFEDVEFKQFSTNTLFEPDRLPFKIFELPKHFTPFRKKVEALTLDLPIKSLDTTLNGVEDESDQWCMLFSVASNEVDESDFKGGERAGQKHLNNYFSEESPSTYKTTRNNLLGWQSSTKFSPWLALGCISPIQIMQCLKIYEEKYGTNESTYWIYFELLWREFFHWNAHKQGQGLFQSKSRVEWRHDESYDTQEFRQWKAGRTGQPLIDACMRELNQTGYLSNRGRQIAASYLIHELGLDWQLGASYFECMLIDYDVASNWGNWQYIAGVGADPRGGRHFNVEKQQQIHDPEGKYVRRWSEVETTDVYVLGADLIV